MLMYRVKEEIGILQNLSNPHVIKFVEAFENNRVYTYSTFISFISRS